MQDIKIAWNFLLLRIAIPRTSPWGQMSAGKAPIQGLGMGWGEVYEKVWGRGTNKEGVHVHNARNMFIPITTI